MAQEIEKDERGFYTLCALNAYDKTEEEMQKVFKKYGNFGGLNRVNNVTFIRFFTKESASSCFKDFQHDKTYGIKKARKKSTCDSQRKEDGNYGSQGGDKSNQSSFPRSERPRNAKRESQEKINSTSELPPMPRLRPACKSPVRDPSKPELEIAKGVMIANLHSEICQKDIYDLCAKTHATPIQVDMRHFKPPNYRTIYYAHVHVKTDNDVENIIKGLNRLKLNGHTLFVNSVDKVLEEAKKEGEVEEETK